MAGEEPAVAPGNAPDGMPILDPHLAGAHYGTPWLANTALSLGIENQTFVRFAILVPADVTGAALMRVKLSDLFVCEDRLVSGRVGIRRRPYTRGC